MASDSCEQLLQAWFPDIEIVDRKPLAETDIRDIAQVLVRTSQASWSRIPRIYSVLRIIGQLEVISSFLDEDITDVWFPFSQRTLPASFNTHASRLDFLDAQHLVFNKKALNLERENTKHGHFPDSTEIPLRKIGELGKGGYGFVDRVISTVSHREYARKLIPRGKTFKKDRQVLKAFERELSNLKSLSQQHPHIIELIGSYTDPKYVGIIMLPVADCNLHELLLRPLGDGETSLLRTFFGCLTSALCFLHDNRIRHKDIKPQNVLLKDGHVFLTDFGVSLDWSELSQSTTTGPTFSTPRYGAPEISEHAARSSSADIWSMGCVFLEIWTVLKRETLPALQQHMESTGAMSSCYCSNLEGVASWVQSVEALPGPSTDNMPATWIKQMMQRDRQTRWTAHELSEQIREHSMDPTARFAFAGLCCLDDEDTAESVHSSVASSTDTDPNDFTLRPSISPTSKSHSRHHAPNRCHTDDTLVSGAPVTTTLPIDSHQPLSLPRPAPADEPPSIDGSILFPDRSKRKSFQQSHVEDETTSLARESGKSLEEPPRASTPIHDYDTAKYSQSKRWIFFSSQSKIPPHVASDIPLGSIPSSPTLHPYGDISEPREGPSIDRDDESDSAYSSDSQAISDSHESETISETESELLLRLEKARGLSPRRSQLPGSILDIEQNQGWHGEAEWSAFSAQLDRKRAKPQKSNSPDSPLERFMRNYRYSTPSDRGRKGVERDHRINPSEDAQPKNFESQSSDTVPETELRRVECRVCMDYFLNLETAKLRCGHRMCHSCLRQRFLFSINGATRMPPTCCSSEYIPLKLVEGLLDDIQKRRWNRKYWEHVYANQIYCPSKGCGKFIEPSRIRMDLTYRRRYARCEDCNTKVCVLCKNKFHMQRRCLEEGTESLRKAVADSRQECYNCRAFVWLNEWSDHMICRCTAQFCMACGAPWKTCKCPWFKDEHPAREHPDDHSKPTFGRHATYVY